MQKLNAIVLTDNRYVVTTKSVEHAKGEYFGRHMRHHGGNFIRVDPLEGSSFGIHREFSSDYSASEAKRYDAATHVLVDTGQPFGLDVEAGFFFDLAPHSLVEGLFEFQYSPREAPTGRSPAVGAARHDLGRRPRCRRRRSSGAVGLASPVLQRKEDGGYGLVVMAFALWPFLALQILFLRRMNQLQQGVGPLARDHL